VRARLALLGLSLGACPEDQPDDPLDPAAIAAVAEAEGDAEGEAFSGPYLAASVQRGCECRQGAELQPCAAVFGLAGLLVVTHVDGYLTLVPTSGPITFGMSGAIDADGTFALAAISGIDALFSVGSVYARLDGRFAGDGFTGDLAYRLLGKLGDKALDCRAQFSVTGQLSAGL
jgi:hypothetical protein